MTCTSCGHALPHGARLCPECGTPCAARCSSCGVDLPPAAKSCAESGTYVLCYALWRDAADDAATCRWFDEVTADLAPRAKGHYVGETALHGSHGTERLRGSFSEDRWARLLDLRRRYDPDGLFAVNVSAIEPSLV